MDFVLKTSLFMFINGEVVEAGLVLFHLFSTCDKMALGLAGARALLY